MTYYLHPETPGKPAPCASRTLGSHCSTGNRRCKSAGLASTEAHWDLCGRLGLNSPLHTVLVLLSQVGSIATNLSFQKHMQQIRPQGSHYPMPWSPSACNVIALPTGSHVWKAGPELLLFKGLVPPCFQQLPWLCIVQWQQINLRLTLSADLCFPYLTQLLWLLEAHAPMQVKLRTTTAFESQILHWERKVITCHSAGGTRSPVPSRYTDTYPSCCTFLQKSHISPVQDWNPSFSIEWQSTTLLVLGGLPPCSAQRPSTPYCNCRRASTPPSKSRNSSPLTEERKEVICTTTRTLAKGKYTASFSQKNTVGAPRKK
jgi:hypothetical protein